MFASAILQRTAAGKSSLRGAAAGLSGDERALLKLLDGVSPVARLIARSGDRLDGDFLRLAQGLEARGLLRQRASASGATSLQITASIEHDRIQTEARRVARTLEEKGFYTHVSRQIDPAARDSTAGLNVLVVEDDEDIAELLTLLLESQGFIVTVAPDAPQVLRYLQGGGAPDLVLLDVVLPTSNGFVILERMRRTTRLHDVPVVMVTSRISDDDVARGLRAGADGYIFKPFQWDTLYACIQSVIGTAATAA
jgi:CheY-like chemotaxis protein